MNKKNVSKMYKRVLAMLLAFVMVVGMVPVTAFAEDGEPAMVETEIDSAVLVKNAKANSEHVPASGADGGAAWAFDDEAHWWHSRWGGTPLEGEVADGNVYAENPIWIQTGFDRMVDLAKLTYASRTGAGSANCGKDYIVSVANLEDPTAVPTDDDFVEVKTGTLEHTENEQEIMLDDVVSATHVRITFTSIYDVWGKGKDYITARRIRVFEMTEADPFAAFAFDQAVLAQNAKANSEHVPASGNDGGAAWAFDNDAHWWHSRWGGTAQEHEVSSGVVSQENPIWIQTGFGKEWFVDSVKYLPRHDQAFGRIKDYTVAVANLEDPTAVPAEEDFTVVKTGTLENVGNAQTIVLDNITAATHVRLTTTSLYTNGGTAHVAAQKIDIFGYDTMPECDKSALQAKVEEYSNVDTSMYTTDTVSAFTDAMANAAAILSAAGARQENVDAALEALTAAFAGFELKGADYSAVEAAIEAANALTKENYVDFSAVEAAIEAVEEGKDITAQAEVDAMAKAITDAIDALVLKADKSRLEYTLETYRNIDLSEYTPSTAAVLADAITAAEAVMEDAYAAQDAVDAAQENLIRAYEALKQKVDMTYLQELADSLSHQNLEFYTVASRTALENALASARELLENEDASQEEVDESAAELHRAYQGLVPIYDLQQYVNVYSALDLSRYTSESAAALEEALVMAREVLAKEDATNDEVDAAESMLLTAYEGLKAKADKTELEMLVAECEVIELDGYTEETAAAFKEALAEAQALLEDEDALQDAVDAAQENLTLAYDGLKLNVDKTYLQGLADSLSRQNLEFYTVASRTALENALASARELIENEDASQEEVDESAAELHRAYQELVAIYNLQQYVRVYSSLDLSEYTPESAAALEEALVIGREVLAKEDATNEEVDAAESMLLAAYEGLKAKADKTELEMLVAECEVIELDGYTEETAAAFKDAFVEALVLLDDENALQDDVDAAVTALTEARDALVEKEVKTELAIITQPTSVDVLNGEIAETTVLAQGDGLTYTWYYKNPGNKKFYASGDAFVNGNTYSIEMANWRDGQEVYCVITDAYGDSVQTDTVTLSIRKAAFEIVSQPEDVVVAAKGDTAEVTVVATGENLTYTWYYKNPGNVKFYVSGSEFVSEDGATYTIPVEKWRDGQEVYCVITDATGASVQSNTVTLSYAK